MKFIYFNDTGRIVTVHPGTFLRCEGSKEPIKPLEQRTFILHGTNPFVKMWDYGSEKGLQILIMPEE